MAPVVQRDPVRTRQALLDAAARAVVAHGTAVSLDAVAREAGVSKGGLLHHFRTRDALLVGLATEWMDRFDAAVARNLDPADQRPGRLCRAHIRASFDPAVEADEQTWRNPAVLTALLSVPEILHHAQQSDRRWRSELHDDGLHPQRVQIITGMLDGMIAAKLFGQASGGDGGDGLQALLLALTEQTGPVVGDSSVV